MFLCFNYVTIMYYTGPVLPAHFKLCFSAVLHRVLVTNTVPSNPGRFFLSILGSFLVWVLRTLQDRLQGFDKSNRNTLVLEMRIN
jgi:hypothetical protein